MSADESPPYQVAHPRIVAMGVGGAGCAVIDRMKAEDLQGVTFVAANTDARSLTTSHADFKVQLGRRLTRGRGTGARPEVGRQAIAESRQEIHELLEGAERVLIIAGMGGGTGTGAAPVIGEIARQLGALTIAFVSKPFIFEGRKRMRQAEMGISEMRTRVDSMVVIPNDRVLGRVVRSPLPFRDALKKADEALVRAIQGMI